MPANFRSSGQSRKYRAAIGRRAGLPLTKTLGFARTLVLHPNQFEVNEAWIAFQLNDAPVRTHRDGAFNCIALMDAASCFIFGTVMILADKPEPSALEVRRLLKKGWEAKRQYPKTLFVPAGRFQNVLPAEAGRQGIDVVPVQGSELRVFIGEAKQGFKQHLEAGGANSET